MIFYIITQESYADLRDKIKRKWVVNIMNEQEFIEKMKDEVLDTESDLSLDMPLDKVEEWDSLSFVSFIAMAKESGFPQVNRDSVNSALTIRDLFELVKC